MTKNSSLFVHVCLKDGRELVIHTSTPAFVAQVTHNDNGTTDIKPVYRLDEFSNDVQRHAALMRRMGDWYYFTIIKKSNDN